MAPVLLNPSRFGTGGASAMQTAMLARSPLAAWMLDETSGTVAADLSGNGRDATYFGPPTLGAASLLSGGSGHSMGTSVDSGQHAGIESASWMNVGELAVCCLTNLTDHDSINGDAVISRLTSLDWVILRDGSDSKWMASVWNNVGTRFNAKQATAASDSTTYHVGFLVADGTLQLFVNGTSAASTPFTGTVATGSAPIEVGRYSTANGTTPSGRFQAAGIFDGSTFTSADMAAIAAAA